MTDGERRERNAKAFLDMESEIMDLAQMANAACMLLELYYEERHGTSERVNLTAAEAVQHTQQWFDAADFGVHHLRDMTKAITRRYVEQLG